MQLAELALTEKLRAALGSQYALGSEIGRGGMSIVYRARDFQNSRDVAVKVLKPDLAETVAVDRFLREIKIVDELQHERILTVLTAGDVAGVPYYVMPYVEGQSLRERIQREKQLPISDAIDIASEVARALNFAHQRGIIHRDVKPENILLSAAGPVVSDFGIARAVEVGSGDPLTSSGVVLGTPSYLSPEQATGASHVDARTDIYALACVLYEMLAGEPPFTGATTAAVVARHIAEQPRPLRTVRPAVQPELDAVLHRALAKVPADRYPTAAAFAEAIANVSNAERLRKVRTRRRVIRVVLTCFGSLAAVVTLWQAMQVKLVPLDENRVVVFPLRAASTGGAEAGYDVALMIGAALEHTEPLKWIDGRQYLQEPSRSNADLVTLESATTISRAHRARYFLEGVIRQDTDSATVVLRLHDARGDSVITQESATGALAAGPIYQLGLSSVRRLLPKVLQPGRTIDLSALSERKPAAIALWMQGEREYRRTRFAQALAFYKRAVQEDSALTYSAIKGAQAANWIMLRDEARQLIHVALAGISTLPPRYGYFARGLEAYLNASADTAVLWLERARAADPEWQEAATALGEVFYHRFPTRSNLDSLAGSAFEAGLAADTMFTPPMLHLIELAVRRGDLRKARTYMQRVRRGEPDTTIARQRALMVECAESGPRKMDWETAVHNNELATIHAAQQLAVRGTQLPCAEAGYRAVLRTSLSAGYRWGALLGLQSILVAQGRTPELIALLDSAITAGTSQAVFLYVIDRYADQPVQNRASAIDEQAQQRFGDQYTGASPNLLWLLGVWHASQGNRQKLEHLYEALTSEAKKSPTQRNLLLKDALLAHVQLARGDTASASTTLQRLAPSADVASQVWDIFEPLEIERLLLAKILLARRDFEGAARIAELFDQPQPAIYPAFLPASLNIRLRAAEELGKRAEAAAFRKRLDALKRREAIAS